MAPTGEELESLEGLQLSQKVIRVSFRRSGRRKQPEGLGRKRRAVEWE